MLLLVFTALIQCSFGIAQMTYSNLCEDAGTACRRFSTLILGTDHLGKVDDQVTVDVLNEAVRLGINTFDTAPIYVNSEYRLGNWLRTLPATIPKLHIITKGGFPFDVEGYGFGFGTYSSRLKGNAEQITRNVLKEIGESRKQLPSNFEISLYLMHRDDFDSLNYELIDRVQTPVKTILEALDDSELRSQFVFLGLSNWQTPRINETQVLSREFDLVRPVANSPYFSLMEMKDADTTIHVGGVQVHHEEMKKDPNSFQRGMKIMPYSPLAGISLFSKTWEEAKAVAYKEFTDGDRYWGHVYPAIFHPDNEQRFIRVQKFTTMYNAKHNTNWTIDQMVNAWALAHPRIDHLIIGPRSVEALRRTVDVLNLYKSLTMEDLDYLYYNNR